MRLKIRDFRDETCLSTEIFLFLRCNAPSIEAKPNYNSKNAFVIFGGFFSLYFWRVFFKNEHIPETQADAAA